MIVQSSHRPSEAFDSSFMQEDFVRACKAGQVVYPYKMVDEGSANVIAK